MYRRANVNAPFDGYIKIGNVMQDEVGKFLVALLADELDEGLRGELLAQLVCRQPVLRERIVELIHS